ncbi:hypothetical protein [Mucilaginibacter sp.]|uniref:hypothetical protein n=1 Tax=Mucilaginibacter sp. TaxID=1882438 RepID=UPI003D0D6346
MKRVLAAAAMLFLLSSFYARPTLSGMWEYSGGIYNDKPEKAPTEYALHRNYDANQYEAFLLEKGQKPEKYEAGDYTLTADSCLETQTFSEQPSKTLNVAIHYQYTVRNDTLTFNGTLPNGTQVKEYWKKIK